MNTIYLYQGDTGTGADAIIENKDGPVDLTDADVLFLFGDHVIYPIKQKEKGNVRLVFEDMHMEVACIFNAYFRVIWSDTRKETFPGPQLEPIKVHIKEMK